MQNLRKAVGFLTVFPAGRDLDYQSGDLGRAAPWFPLVGAFIGLLAGLAGWGLGIIFPPLLAAVFTLAVWESLSGWLHLDGLADCCDGLLPAAAPQRRLEIMRDARLGTFGTAGLILFLAAKGAALGYAAGGWQTLLTFMLAGSTGRWLVIAAARQPLARPGGMGAEMTSAARMRSLILAGLIPLSLALPGGWRGLAGLGLALLAGWGLFRFSRARIGGVTGDVMGCAIELGELACLLPFCLIL